MMTKHHLNISSTSRLGYPHLRFLSGLGHGFLSQNSLLNATSFKFQIDRSKENDTKLILEHFKATLRTNLDEIKSKKVGATLFSSFSWEPPRSFKNLPNQGGGLPREKSQKLRMQTVDLCPFVTVLYFFSLEF